MYAAKKREGLFDVPQELAEVGEKLKLALKLGRGDPETLGHKAAWSHAEEATSRLMRLITLDTRLAPTVEAAVIRIRLAKREPSVSKSEARKTGLSGGRR